MKFFFGLFALIAAAFAAPQFFPGGGFGGSGLFRALKYNFKVFTTLIVATLFIKTA